MKPIYILGTSGKINDYEKYSIEELLSIAGLNTGNLVFQYAVNTLLKGPKNFVGLSGIPYNVAAGCQDGSYLVFPAANHLRTGADWSGLCGFFQNSKIPLIVLGLGAQAHSAADPEATAAALRADTSAMRLVKVLQDKAAWITVRGAFTAKVCELLDIKNVDVMGCPSWMLNTNSNAGILMAQKLALAKEKTQPNISLTAAAPFEIRGSHKEKLERALWKIAHAMNGLYVQQSGGEAAIAFASRKMDKLPTSALLSIRSIIAPDITLDDLIDYIHSRGRVFFDAPQWIDAMKPFDCSFGTRLHGNMVAIASGTPGCVISHDSRTDELAEYMLLPRISSEEVLASDTVHQLFNKIQFEPAAFDDARLRTARIYEDRFSKLGLEFESPMMPISK